MFLLEDKYACTLFALALIFFTYFFDWSFYKSTLEEIKIFDYLSRKTYIFAIIFLVISGIIQNKYTEIPNRSSEILPIFDNVSQTFFIYIIHANLTMVLFWRGEGHFKAGSIEGNIFDFERGMGYFLF